MGTALGWKRGNGWVGSRVTGGLETGYAPLKFGLQVGYLLELYIRTIILELYLLEQSWRKAKSNSYFFLFPFLFLLQAYHRKYFSEVFQC